jgi:hypothetical protein
MSISVEGLSLIRPTSSFQREFFKDNYGEIIGVKDSVTISDIVTYKDTNDLKGYASSLFSFLEGSSGSFLNISYGETASAIFNGFNIDQDSDFVNKLVYSVSFDAFPNVTINSRWGFSSSLGLRSLTALELVEESSDMYRVSLVDGNSYYNKYPIFKFNAQLSCVSTSNGQKPKDKAIQAISIIKKTKPSTDIDKVSGGAYSGYTSRIIGVEESYSEDGSASVNITTAIIPPDATRPNVLIETEEPTVNDFFGEKQYSTKQYRVTFKSMSAGMGVDTDPGVKDEGTINSPIGAAMSLVAKLIELKTTPDVTTPGNKNLPCPLDIPKLPPNSCYNTTSVGIEKDYSAGTATVVIDQTTEPTNCDGDGYVVEWSINTNKNKRAHAELFGWSASSSIVQDLKCEATDTVDINVNVSSEAKCLVSELRNKAKDKFDELKEPYEESGTMVKHNLSVNAGRCTISASFIMSKGDSVVST